MKEEQRPNYYIITRTQTSNNTNAFTDPFISRLVSTNTKDTIYLTDTVQELKKQVEELTSRLQKYENETVNKNNLVGVQLTTKQILNPKIKEDPIDAYERAMKPLKG